MVLNKFWGKDKATGDLQQGGDFHDAVLNRGLPGGDVRLATGQWLRGENLIEEAQNPATELYFSTKLQKSRRDAGTVYLGATEPSGGEPLGWCDDRHLMTIAGSRAGKGVSAILPNLYLYPGPIVCIDPKGENATETAVYRAETLGHDVHVLDPYSTVNLADNTLRSAFDPLYGLKLRDPEIIEKINLIAEGMVLPSDGKDKHWDELSRSFIAALIGHVITVADLDMPRNLITVRTLFRKGDMRAAQRLMDERSTPYVQEDEAGLTGELQFDRPEISAFDALLESMRRNESFDGMISGFAQRLMDMGFEERGSVLSSTDRHTRFLDGVSMQSVLVKPQGGRKHLNLAHLKKGGKPITVYLSLPTRYLATHSRWLRLMINAIVSAVEITPADQTEDRHRILAILDEFPVLGHMQTLEAAIGYMAGYGIRIWAILQDLSQLKRDYPKSWETFIGNTGVQQFFGNTDQTTLEYISKSLGETEVIRETRTTGEVSAAELEAHRRVSRSAIDTDGYQSNIQTVEQVMKVSLLTPDEIRIKFSRSNGRQILLTAEYDPIVAYRRKHYEMLPDGTLEALAARR